MSSRDVDMTFGVDWQARAVLVSLSPLLRWDESPVQLASGVRVSTRPLYNGREQHAAVMTSVNLGPCLLLSFGECRNSDQLTVWREELPREPMNGPTCKCLTQEGYRARKSFEPGRSDLAAAYIAGEIEKWVEVQS